MSQVPNSNPNPSSPAPVPPTATTGVPDRNVHSPAGDSEEVYYEGTPRIRGHLGHVFLYGSLGLLFIVGDVLIGSRHHIPWWLSVAMVVIGIVLFTVPILIVKRNRYRITNYRIDYERGLLSTTINTIELWHVEDIQFHQSLGERILEVGTIEVVSHDKQTPTLFIRGIPHARKLFTTLEQRIIAVKRQQGVLKIDS